LKEKAAKGQLKRKNMIKELYYFIIDFFSDYKRLRIWRTIPLIPNEKRSQLQRLIAEKDMSLTSSSAYFFKGLENGEISRTRKQCDKVLFLQIQGILDGCLNPKNAGKYK
jgi:hypothetical protein